MYCTEYAHAQFTFWIEHNIISQCFCKRDRREKRIITGRTKQLENYGLEKVWILLKEIAKFCDDLLCQTEHVELLHAFQVLG